MDELKPEDDMKADRSDRRTGRSRQSSERDADPQINFDDVELDDADDGRPTRGSKARRERDEEQYEEYEEEVESDEDDDEERQVERRPRKRKKAPAKPASRQYIMMGVGILVLLLLIVGVGSALKSPSSSSEQTASGEKSINLSGEQDNNNNTQPAAQDSSAANNAQPQDVSLPPIASNPTQGQATAEPQGQQRVEVQGDLNNALTQQQGQIDSAVANSTLPTEPATVAPVRNGTAAPRQATTERQTAATPRPAERKHTVIEPKPQATAKAPTQPKPAAVQPKRVENVATTTPAAAQPTKPAATAQAKPAATTAPAATATTAPAATAAAAAAPAATAAAGKSAGDVSSMKSAPSGHYTLQLSSSSNYNNLNSWAKKEKLEKYVVYETTRNGQPWYVLVSGIYASKDEAKRAVATLPADVQAKNPWAKPLHQVQSDLK
ncbi:cell division protein DamX [Klebsiella michiganensis]|uniref:cell division protein DamX n=2 Tax=Klebsiella michiganensis TaxID=1134687 RepID=UPI000D64DCF3|nr:cell division protein DamX [Klebsiella michiganensis]MDL4443422.1 cell division protein DamX [Klebsiella michiganensis]MDL4487687.1 cell division protein DamX [Klebsiella michiganensis]MDL4656421.1 cell division protein DamX [Klebsiella michiganensis]HCT3872309.1 cell division protein DamX [Klebsiella michiganensis]HDX8783578.1 cell division protein DamX [Klebsiella michiganensis]